MFLRQTRLLCDNSHLGDILVITQRLPLISPHRDINQVTKGPHDYKDKCVLVSYTEVAYSSADMRHSDSL